MAGVERFLSMIGGEANLPPVAPPKEAAPQTTLQVQAQESDDPFEGLPTVEEVIERNRIMAEEARARRPKPRQAHLADQHHFVSTPTTITTDDSISHMRLGDAAPRGINFTPFLAVTRFCYKFVGDKWRQPLATAFFDAKKIYNRPWDVYYIWSDHYQTSKPIVLVPGHQLQALINDINQAFPEAKIGITDELREYGLVVNCDDLPDSLRPVWLGRSTSWSEYEEMAESAPFPSHPAGGKMPDNRSLEAFKEMIEKILELNKAKSKAKRQVGQQAAIQRRGEINKQVLRAQRYLGLLPKKEEDLLEGMSNLVIAAVDPEQAPLYPFDMDVVIIAFDCEAYERSPKTITEVLHQPTIMVGMATLDTRDLRGEAPGTIGQNWHKHIRARHFRLAEYKHLRNHEFVAGCPDAFEFGKSEFVPKNDLASVLTSCFHHPFSKPFSKTETEWPALGAHVGQVNGEKRNIVLLGHDINQDIAYLQNVGFSVLNRGNLVEALDTAIMFKSFTRDNNSTSLGRILYHFDLVGWFLHNAGNDAVYTMHGMIAIAVKVAAERGSEEVEKKHEEAVEKRITEAAELAKEKAKEDAEGWTVNADEDGGVAVLPTDESFESKRQKAQRPV
ncbi:hypothetical protein LTR15_001835 [Elasticomyces elasticus]|nr:hypothetical protein LTR15_001835 [Elasticomyces elasticus]